MSRSTTIRTSHLRPGAEDARCHRLDDRPVGYNSSRGSVVAARPPSCCGWVRRTNSAGMWSPISTSRPFSIPATAGAACCRSRSRGFAQTVEDDLKVPARALWSFLQRLRLDVGIETPQINGVAVTVSAAVRDDLGFSRKGPDAFRDSRKSLRAGVPRLPRRCPAARKPGGSGSSLWWIPSTTGAAQAINSIIRVGRNGVHRVGHHRRNCRTSTTLSTPSRTI